MKSHIGLHFLMVYKQSIVNRLSTMSTIDTYSNLANNRSAHRLVEKAMIAANLCAATLLRDQLGYGIFNVHAGLELSQIEQVVALLKANEITLLIE